ncbi:MAG TPA: hypothetical protein VLM79_38015, partial [Kofleriaceae bacterium]|nr:hypothetical protein [Kofleriaceae bacterium]
ATAFEMLTGAPPFVGAVPVILSSKATEEAPDLARRGIPPRVAHTIRRMLAREPKHRAPSMAWVLEEVASWLEPDRAREIDNPTDRITREEPTVVDWNPGGDRPAAIAHGSSEHLTPPRSPSAPTISNASTPAATSGMTTRDAIRAVSPPRARTWIALAVTAGALAIGAAAALLGGTSSSTASPASTHPASTPPASTPSTPPATTSVPTTPVDLPPANPPTQAAENPSTPSNTASPDVASPNTASPNMAMPNTPSQNATVQNTRSQRRPPKAPDKKPGKKPTTTKPGDSKDILIVDPFSSPRSDSP